MSSDNQKIIFDVQGDDTPVKIVSGILIKNGIQNPLSDITSETDTPKVLMIINSAKNLFDKKIYEKELIALFQKKLNITQETAIKILQEINAKLIPYAQKINIRENEKILEETKGDINIPQKKQKNSTIEKSENHSIDKYRESIG